MQSVLSGYSHPAYVASLAEFGDPVHLPRSGGWLLRRKVPGTELHDAMGPYPYLACLDWQSLKADLDELQLKDPDLVSITAAADPFGSYTEDDLRRAFPDLCHPYKQHYVADLSLPADRLISDHHRREVTRAASRGLAVEDSARPLEYLETWLELFEHPKRQFAITGIRAFSRTSFQTQLGMPGARIWLVRQHAAVIAAAITMEHNGVAYTHLLAATASGRKQGASYVIYDAHIRRLHPAVRWIDWGAVPGNTDAETGLKLFKSGWASGTKPAYICGRICNRNHYDSLARDSATSGAPYFPCYRHGA